MSRSSFVRRTLLFAWTLALAAWPAALVAGEIGGDNLELGPFNSSYTPFNDEVLFDLDGNPDTQDDQVRINGNISVNLGQFDFCLLCPQTEVTAAVSMRAAFEISGDFETEFEETISIPEGLPLPPITGVLPGGLEYSVTSIVLPSLTVSGTLEAKGKISVVGQAEIPFGVVISGGEVTFTSGDPASFFDLSPPALSGSVTASISSFAFATVNTTVSVDGVPFVTGSVKAGPGIRLNVSPFSDPWWTLQGGFQVLGGVGPGTEVTTTQTLFRDGFRLSSAPPGEIPGDTSRGVRWAKVFDFGSIDVGQSIAEARDGNGWVFGATVGAAKGVLAAIDRRGSLVWQKEYTNGFLIRSVATGPTGTFFVAGGLTTTGPAWLMKVDERGEVLWSKRYDWNEGATEFNFAEPTSDGGLIAAGAVLRNPENRSYNFLVKVDSDGVVEWSKRYGATSPGQLGTNEVHETSDGGFIAAGTVNDSPLEGSFAAYFFKVDSAGDLEWEYIPEPSNEGFSAIETSDGGFLFTGYDQRNVFSELPNSAFVAKTDASGNEQWLAGYSGEDLGLFEPGNSAFDQWSQVREIDQGYLLSGKTGIGDEQDAWLMRLDLDGRLVWFKAFRGEDEDTFNELLPTLDGGLIAVGATQSYGDGFSDVWIAKTAVDGMLRFAEGVPGTVWNEIAEDNSMALFSGVASTSVVDVPLTVADEVPDVADAAAIVTELTDIN